MKSDVVIRRFEVQQQITGCSCAHVAAAIVENGVGYTVSVGIERSTPHRLQTLPLIRLQDAGPGKRYVYQLMHAILAMLLP